METGAHWRNARVAGLALHDGIWTVACDDGTAIAARFAIDATGRAASLARALPGTPRPERLDRLIACIVHFEDCAAPHADTSVETFEDGWWLATPLPDGRRLVALLSDSDIVRQLGVADPRRWQAKLMDTQLIARAVRNGKPCAPPRLVPAGTRRQAIPLGLPLLAAGDAAASFDPLSSQGIAKALRAGAFAAYAAADFLESRGVQGLARYRAFADDEFAQYRATWRRIYREETRWPDRSFWRRRHSDPEEVASHRNRA